MIKKVVYLADAGRAIGLEPWQFVCVNAIGLVYQSQENYLYMAHLDRAFVSIYDLNNDQFLSKIYCLNGRSGNVSVIDVNSKVGEKVIDLHAY